MSARKSRLRKILRQREREIKKADATREKYRKPGETDEQMEARMIRDLSGWLNMMEEREVEEALVSEAQRLETIEKLESVEVTEDQITRTDTNEEEK